jgi:ankyrin repeat protein
MENFDAQKDGMFLQIKKKDDDDKYIFGQQMYDAVECGELDEVKRIFDILRESHGVKDSDLKDIMYITPLANASKYGHLRICEFLVENGADVNHYVNDSMIGDGVFSGSDYYDTERTPLTYAAEYGHTDVCEFLVKTGANIELPSSNDGFTPLAFASKNGHLPVCEFLIGAGANVNNAEEWSATPLALASYENHLSICELLIRSGADINLADQEGRSPIYWASMKNNIEIIALFQ